MKLYISSYEYQDFDKPRKIIRYQKTELSSRNTLIVEVEEPLIGQKYGLLDYDVTTFYLINRVNEHAFDHLNRFPIDVYVLIIKNNMDRHIVSLDQLQNIAWACLYDNLHDTLVHLKK